MTMPASIIKYYTNQVTAASQKPHAINDITPLIAVTASLQLEATSIMQAEDLELCGNFLRRFSFLQVISLFLRIVKILQVEVEGLLSVEQLIVDRRLKLPAHFNADICESAIARLCCLANFHLFGHLSLSTMATDKSLHT